MEQKMMKALARKIDNEFEKNTKSLMKREKSFPRSLMGSFWKRQSSTTSDMRQGRKREKAGRFCKRRRFSFSFFFPSIPLQSGLRMPTASLCFRCLKTMRIIP